MCIRDRAGTEYTSEELIEHWAKLCEKYPIISIEDGLDEEDWEGWQKLTARLGDKVDVYKRQEMHSACFP